MIKIEIPANKYRGGTSDATIPTSHSIDLNFLPSKTAIFDVGKYNETDGRRDGQTDGRTDRHDLL